MQQPSFIPIPFAANGNKDTIPLTKQTTGRASWNTGFPPETSLPQGAGGYAPMRTDFQGVLYELSAHIFFGQSGNLYAWDATLDYNAWAHVLDTDGNGVTREYIAIAQNGPTTSNVTQPYLDVNFACWKPITLFMTDYVYPVGSIYMTTEATNPGTIFGGTWAKIESRFLVGASSTYQVTSTNDLSSATHTLTVDEMPAHNHGASAGQAGAGTYNLTINNSVSHTHDISINNGAQSAGAHNHGVTYTATAISTSAVSNGAHTHGAPASKTTITTSNPSPATHYHTRGTMNIEGKFSGVGQKYDGDPATVNGAFYVANTKNEPTQGVELSNSGARDDYFGFDASRPGAWTGHTSSDGTHTHTVTINASSMTTVSAGAHTHGVSFTIPAKSMTTTTVEAHTHNVVGTSNQGGVHNHTGSVTISNHTHTISTQNRGGGNAFSIIPPYYAVYIWRRTA